MRQNKRKGSSTSPTVGRGVAHRAACHRSGAFFFGGIGSAFRQPVTSLSLACSSAWRSIPSNQTLRPHRCPPKAHDAGRSFTLLHAPVASLGFDGRLLRKSKRTAWHGIFPVSALISGFRFLTAFTQNRDLLRLQLVGSILAFPRPNIIRGPSTGVPLACGCGTAKSPRRHYGGEPSVEL